MVCLVLQMIPARAMMMKNSGRVTPPRVSFTWFLRIAERIELENMKLSSDSETSFRGSQRVPASARRIVEEDEDIFADEDLPQEFLPF